MRICLYTETALPKMGGQEVFVDALSRRFLAMGHEPVVLAPHPRLPLRADDEPLPYPVYRHWRFYSTRFLVGWYRRFLCNLHRQLRFDVLHCHGIYPPAYLAGLSRDSLNIPVVATSHGGDINPLNVRLVKPVVRARYIEGLRAADALVAISRYTRDGYLRLCSDLSSIVDIPNGVDLEPFTSQAARPADLNPRIKPEEYVLFLGRLRRQKGVDVLLRALALLPVTGNIELVVAGDGEYRNDLQTLCRQLDLMERVSFLGQVTGKKKVYLLQNAVAAVVPSRGWEAFGLVVFESYAAGRPVIASNLPGLASNVQPGRTGFVFPPEDHVALAERLQQAATEPELMQQMGRAARRLAAKYTWKSVATQHIDLYDQLLGSDAGIRLAA